MTAKTNHSSRGVMFVLNTLGFLGYAAILLEISWLAILYLPGLLASDVGRSLLPPERQQQPLAVQSESAIVNSVPLSAIILISAGAVGFVIIMIALAIRSFPSDVGRAGHATIRASTDMILPVFSSKKATKKQRLKIGEQISFWLKVAIAVILGLIPIIFAAQATLAQPVVVFVSIFLIVWPIIWFSTQRFLGRLWKVSYDSYW